MEDTAAVLYKQALKVSAGSITFLPVFLSCYCPCSSTFQVDSS